MATLPKGPGTPAWASGTVLARKNRTDSRANLKVMPQRHKREDWSPIIRELKTSSDSSLYVTPNPDRIPSEVPPLRISNPARRAIDAR